MQFVDNGFFPRTTLPTMILPFEAFRIDDFAGTMHIVRLKAGSWIGNLLRIVDAETILRARLCGIGDQFKPAVILRFQWKQRGTSRASQAKRDPPRSRCPQAKAHTSFVAILSAEGHFMTALHSLLPSCRSCAPSAAVPSESPWNVPAMDKLIQNRASLPGATRRHAMYPSMRPSGIRDETPAM